MMLISVLVQKSTVASHSPPFQLIYGHTHRLYDLVGIIQHAHLVPVGGEEGLGSRNYDL